MFVRHCCVIVALLLTLTLTDRVTAQEVVVFESIDSIISWLKAEDFWGEEQRGAQLEVPNVIIAGINPRWREQAQNLHVPYKKEIFYRFMLPLVLHANNMVLDAREKLQWIQSTHESGAKISNADNQWFADLAAMLRVEYSSPPQMIDEMLYKLDIIPAGLALGQAAYESGYGSSRFAVEGNALFGQWTYGGKGLVPEQQRKNLGDHRIAAFDWPFDSVRGYFINLMTHPAYEEFRKLRADARAAGRPVTSLEMADGLIRYSERGQEYVDTLKGIIRVNKLDIADDADFRDEPMRFAIGADGEDAAKELSAEIERLRSTGELAEIIDRMRLE